MVDLKDFCERTSLHGWAFLPYRGFKPLQNVFWLSAIITSIACASIIIFGHYIEFKNATVSYQIESPTVPLEQVFFPSITLCNMNKLRKSFIFSLFADNQIADLTTFNNLLEFVNGHFIEGSISELTDSQKLLKNTILQSKVYDDMYQDFVHASVNVDVENITDLYFEHIQSVMWLDQDDLYTEETKLGYFVELANQYHLKDMLIRLDLRGFGINHDGGGFPTDVSDTCHWFTPLVQEPSDPSDLWTINPSARNGLVNGLQLILDAESYDYASSETGTEGFFLSMLHQLDIPIMRNTGINVEVGQTNNIVVVPTLMSTTDGARSRFNPQERQCYFEDEITLKHLPHDNSFRHDISNCLFEATLQKIESECQCIPTYFTDVSEFPSCQGQQVSCMNDLKERIGEFRAIMDSNTEKLCLSNCQDQTFSVSLTQASYPNSHSFVHTKEYQLIHNKLLRSCLGDRNASLQQAYPTLCITLLDITANQQEIEKEVVRYAKENIAKVNIFFKDPFVKKIVREEKISQIAFVGTVGGLLGLFLGFSFISSLEIFYMIFLRIWLKCSIKKKEKSTITPVFSNKN